jgi:hypothetical protein
LPSSDDAGAESEEAGATLDEETSDATDEEDSGADSEDFATSSEEPGSVLDESFDSEEVFSELEDFAPAESSAEELDKSELSLEGVSAAFADEESSPQATRSAAEKATKASTCDLIRGNIPKTVSTEA